MLSVSKRLVYNDERSGDGTRTEPLQERLVWGMKQRLPFQPLRETRQGGVGREYFRKICPC
jgi:hypothetical protein